jgi:hypothetical protein
VSVGIGMRMLSHYVTVCIRCGYDVRQSLMDGIDRCPECGASLPANAVVRRRSFTFPTLSAILVTMAPAIVVVMCAIVFEPTTFGLPRNRVGAMLFQVSFYSVPLFSLIGAIMWSLQNPMRKWKQQIILVVCGTLVFSIVTYGVTIAVVLAVNAVLAM